ncbi:unnamed protein product [Boreogadus saida]
MMWSSAMEEEGGGSTSRDSHPRSGRAPPSVLQGVGSRRALNRVAGHRERIHLTSHLLQRPIDEAVHSMFQHAQCDGYLAPEGTLGRLVTYKTGCAFTEAIRAPQPSQRTRTERASTPSPFSEAISSGAIALE